MTIVDLVSLLAAPLDTAVVLTGSDLGRPGPTIQWANAAFTAMSGYALDEMVGRSPRDLQGAGTNRLVARSVRRELLARGRFLGRLTNYRRDGEPYICELDVRTLRDRGGAVEAFIAFEREVVRRRGHPSRGGAGRYRPVLPSATPLAAITGAQALFEG